MKKIPLAVIMGMGVFLTLFLAVRVFWYPYEPLLQSGTESITVSTMPYNEKVSYTLGKPLSFTDFSLTYGGSTSYTTPFKLTLIQHVFTVESHEGTKQITWSSGAGEVAGSKFEANSRVFYLEKGMSEMFGQLKEDELVIRTEAAH